jgi:hypothetical protein
MITVLVYRGSSCVDDGSLPSCVQELRAYQADIATVLRNGKFLF